MNIMQAADTPIVIPVEIRAQGRFRAVVHTGHEYDEFGRITKFGRVLRQTHFGNNKITLTGFNKLFANQGGSLCMVAGSGNTAPAEGNTTLVSYLGKTNTFASASCTRNTTPDGNGDVWWRVTKRMTFGPSSLGGGSVNVAEAAIVTNVALGSINGSTPVSARGLLVDGSNNPTTVSVNNAIEYLDIIWEYTEWVKASVTGTVTLTIDGSSVVHDYEVRPYYFDFTGASYEYHGWADPGAGTWGPGWSPVGDSTYGWDDASNCFTTGIQNITGDPLGSGTRADIPIQTSAAYTADSKQRSINFTWLPVNANKNINVVRVNLGHTEWQVSYDPAIAKVNTKQLDLQFLLTYANK